LLLHYSHYLKSTSPTGPCAASVGQQLVAKKETITR
jgi:hypothetical protein